MNVSQAAGYVNSYMTTNIKDIGKLYAKITEAYLDIKKHKEDDPKFYKNDCKKFNKKIDETFDKAKRGRSQFVEAITELREAKSDSDKKEDVGLSCSSFLGFEDKLEDHKKRVEKSLKLMTHEEESLKDKAENDERNNDNILEVNLVTNFKRIQITKIKSQCERLLKLIESDLKFLGEVTSIYD